MATSSSVAGGSGYDSFGEYRIQSVFQPIFSMGHRRVVGFEALVRGRDLDDELVSPATLFGRASCDATESQLDQICQRVHVDNFSRDAPDNNWLFLNIDPATLHNKQYRDEFLPGVLEQADFPFHRLVVEVLETPAVDESDLLDAVQYFRSLGALVALDDFGVGRSNFDRIWRLAPDIIKLDRSIIWEASKHLTGSLRRMLPNLIAMMHEAGSLVLIEGIENETQLMLALDAEADFVQGFYMAHPAHAIAALEDSTPEMEDLNRKLAASEFHPSGSCHDTFKAYIQEIRSIRGKFNPGVALGNACATLLAMSNVLRVFVLDEEGHEIIAFLSEQNKQSPDKRFSPMVNTAGGNWAQREYFREAINQPQQVHVSRPYLSSTEGRMCLMLSISNQAEPRRVFCCKLLLDQ